jgi:hypothetical protein
VKEGRRGGEVEGEGGGRRVKGDEAKERDKRDGEGREEKDKAQKRTRTETRAKIRWKKKKKKDTYVIVIVLRKFLTLVGNLTRQLAGGSHHHGVRPLGRVFFCHPGEFGNVDQHGDDEGQGFTGTGLGYTENIAPG